MTIEHKAFPKIARYKEQKVVVTEKIDGSNGLIFIDTETNTILAGSRNRWITPEDDNFGFAQFVHDNSEDLMSLGDGYHYGEWWGQGIQRRYAMDQKIFSLFNNPRWANNPIKPECCDVVPHVFAGTMSEYNTFFEKSLQDTHSYAAEKYDVLFNDVEGYMVWFAGTKEYMKHIISK